MKKGIIHTLLLGTLVLAGCQEAQVGAEQTEDKGTVTATTKDIKPSKGNLSASANASITPIFDQDVFMSKGGELFVSEPTKKWLEALTIGQPTVVAEKEEAVEKEVTDATEAKDEQTDKEQTLDQSLKGDKGTSKADTTQVAEAATSSPAGSSQSSSSKGTQASTSQSKPAAQESKPAEKKAESKPAPAPAKKPATSAPAAKPAPKAEPKPAPKPEPKPKEESKPKEEPKPKEENNSVSYPANSITIGGNTSSWVYWKNVKGSTFWDDKVSSATSQQDAVDKERNRWVNIMTQDNLFSINGSNNLWLASHSYDKAGKQAYHVPSEIIVTDRHGVSAKYTFVDRAKTYNFIGTGTYGNNDVFIQTSLPDGRSIMHYKLSEKLN